ncbi:MAG: hypothetical protein R3C97_04490 [Geminicoccaceae bacterium]
MSAETGCRGDKGGRRGRAGEKQEREREHGKEEQPLHAAAFGQGVGEKQDDEAHAAAEFVLVIVDSDPGSGPLRGSVDADGWHQQDGGHAQRYIEDHAPGDEPDQSRCRVVPAEEEGEDGRTGQPDHPFEALLRIERPDDGQGRKHDEHDRQRTGADEAAERSRQPGDDQRGCIEREIEHLYAGTKPGSAKHDLDDVAAEDQRRRHDQKIAKRHACSGASGVGRGHAVSVNSIGEKPIAVRQAGKKHSTP